MHDTASIDVHTHATHQSNYFQSMITACCSIIKNYRCLFVVQHCRMRSMRRRCSDDWWRAKQEWPLTWHVCPCPSLEQMCVCACEREIVHVQLHCLTYIQRRCTQPSRETKIVNGREMSATNTAGHPPLPPPPRQTTPPGGKFLNYSCNQPVSTSAIYTFRTTTRCDGQDNEQQ